MALLALLAFVSIVPAADRVPWQNTRLRGTPEPRPPYTVERVFERIEWKAPLYIVPAPGGDELLVILQNAEGLPARIVRFANDPQVEQVETVLEVSGRLVYSLAFHPRFAENGYVFIFSNGPTPEPTRVNRVSRYTATRSPALVIDPASELSIIEWSSSGHDGGDLAFGNDGMLYISTGDGTSDSDTLNTGQGLDDLLGTILRIDVDRTEGQLAYAVPADNPFVGVAGARGEIWAYGLRNPWRIDFDRPSGDLWVGNNGQDLWETVHLVRRGDNLGWSVYEGNHPFYLHRQRGPTPIVPTTIEHSHADFRSLTGGVVYRGDKLPELEGAYIYGDYATGKIWGARHRDGAIAWSQELADTALQIAAFRVDQRGELLIVDHGGGIYRLMPDRGPPGATDFPRRLSETGLFDVVAVHRPAAGLIPYAVNAPGWADGATAQRYLALPADAKIDFTSSRGWNFDDGAVLVQTLTRDARRVETRIMVKHQKEWAGYSYRWNEEQTDAELVPKEGADEPGWRFPSRAECLTCHSRAANFVLGLSEAQANLVEPDGREQLRRFEELGLFRALLPKAPSDMARLADPYDERPMLEARARSYLHVNCSICHVAAGGGNAQMELDFATSADKLNLVEARPQHDSFGIADAMLVAPASPERSVLVHRLSRRGRGQMPPLVNQRVDETAVTMFAEWIATLRPKRTFVRAWTMDDLRPALAEAATAPSSESGAALYRELGCAQCHRRGKEGGTVGPDMSDVAARLSPEKLLEALVEPSASIAEGYAAVILELDDGTTVTGRIEREDAASITLRTGPAAADVATVVRASIVSQGPSRISNMPSGMLNTLKEEEVVNLISYLLMRAERQ